MSDSQQPYSPQPTSPPPSAPTTEAAPSPYGPPADAYSAANQFPPTAPPAKRGNGLGLAALILGIVALIGAFIPFVNYVSGVIAVAGIILGIIAITRKDKPKKAGMAGLIVSVIALILSIVLAIAYTVGFVAAVDEALPQTNVQQSEGSEPAEAAEVVEDAEPEAATEVGTRENPAPIGTTVQVTSVGAPQYDVTLGAPILDATQIIAAENPFNEAAPAGFQYAVVPVTVTYTGTETGTPWIDLQVQFVSAAGTTHTEADTLAVGPSPTFMEVNELYPGAGGTGSVVIAIPTADAAAGAWTVAPLFSGDTFFFAAQ